MPEVRSTQGTETRIKVINNQSKYYADLAAASATNAANSATSAANSAQEAHNYLIGIIETTQRDIDAIVQNAEETITENVTEAENAIDSKVEEAEGDIDTAVTNAESRIDTKIETAESTIDELTSDITEIQEQIDTIEQSIDTIEAEVTLAHDWAVKTDGLVDNEDYSSKYYALSSQSYATNSATSATNASSSATSAANSATSASNSASSASSYANQATTAASTATTASQTATQQAEIATTAAQRAQQAVQSDWNETDTTSRAYIQNKPSIPSPVTVDQTYDSTSTNAQSGTAVSGALTPYQLITQSMTSLSASGSISLSDNTINKISATGAVTFTLPTVTDLTKFHQIFVQLNMASAQTIDLGTTYYFGGAAPEMTDAGTYNIIYEYDNTASHWVVGALVKGAAS